MTIHRQIKADSDFLKLEVDLSLTTQKSGTKNRSESTILLSVLVVDDDLDMRNYIRGCLMDNFEKVQVIEAENGQAALTLLQNIKPGLLITDLSMPVMNGLELVDRIVGDFNNWTVPVLIISGKDQHPSTHQNVMELPNWDVLKKPFSEDSLISHIDHLLNKKS